MRKLDVHVHVDPWDSDNEKRMSVSLRDWRLIMRMLREREKSADSDCACSECAAWFALNGKPKGRK